MPPPSKATDPKLSPVAGEPAGVRHIRVGQWGRTYAEALQAVCIRAFPEATVAISCSGQEIIEALTAQHADLLLLAPNLPDMHGADVLRRIVREKLATRVLVALHHRDERSLLALRDAQFDGLLDTQEEGVEALVKALHLVAAGQPYISPVFRGRIIDRAPIGVISQKLTPREIRVFAAIGDGSGNEEAARQLGLTPSTVQTYRRNLMHKLGIPNSAKLVREAIRLGIVRITADGSVIRAGS
jgi:DNA-binding NarL/FixJ family response regulator